MQFTDYEHKTNKAPTMVGTNAEPTLSGHIGMQQRGAHTEPTLVGSCPV